MSEFATDTLSIYKKLIAAGVDEREAEAQVLAMQDMISSLATKQDIGLVRKDIEVMMSGLLKELRDFEIRLNNQLHEFKLNIYWVIGIGLVGSIAGKYFGLM